MLVRNYDQLLEYLKRKGNESNGMVIREATLDFQGLNRVIYSHGTKRSGVDPRSAG